MLWCLMVSSVGGAFANFFNFGALSHLHYECRPFPLFTAIVITADHRWAWHAFYSGASVALYVFLYSVYYFLFRTE